MYIRGILIGALALLTSFAAQAADASPTVKGFTVLGSVSRSLSVANDALGVRYWTKYVGGDVSVGVEHVSIDASGANVIKATDLSVNGGVLVGFPVGRIKPYMRLGFGYSYLNDDVSNVTLNVFELDPSMGIDFAATKHLLFGVTVLSFPVAVAGDVNGTGISGYDLSALSEFHVGYTF